MSRSKAICKEVKIFLREKSYCIKRKTTINCRDALGSHRRILDLYVDLIPLPAKYYSLKNGIEIQIRRFFVSSVRSSNSHPDLLLTHHPTPLFQITPVLDTGLSLSEPLQLYQRQSLDSFAGYMYTLGKG